MNQPRIAIVGNCQATTLSRPMRLFVPGIEIRVFTVDDLPTLFAGAEGLLAELDKFDVVFAQPYRAIHFPELDGTRLKELRKGVIQFPNVEFPAFHPDCIYVPSSHNGWHFIQSPLGDYNSAIVFLGHTLGLSIDETIKLFNEDVYDRVGYFQVWNPAEQFLFAAARSIGFPIERLYRSWLRRGCFMHSVNHPKIWTMADVAAALLDLSGIPRACESVESFIPDQGLFGAVWPIYTEIGKPMGLAGNYLFKRRTISDDQNQIATLREFVSGSYAAYDTYPPNTWQSTTANSWRSTRIQEWMADSKFVEYIMSYRTR